MLVMTEMTPAHDSEERRVMLSSLDSTELGATAGSPVIYERRFLDHDVFAVATSRAGCLSHVDGRRPDVVTRMGRLTDSATAEVLAETLLVIVVIGATTSALFLGRPRGGEVEWPPWS
jgi:hypothetical protein